MSYRIVEHTADIRLKLSGKSQQELFISGFTALTKIIAEQETKTPKSVSRQINLQAGDTTSLLIDFLNEVLTLTQIYKETYTDLKIIKLTTHKILAVLSGYKVKRFATDIKAVTYHQAHVSKNARGWWRTILVLDI